MLGVKKLLASPALERYMTELPTPLSTHVSAGYDSCPGKTPPKSSVLPAIRLFDFSSSSYCYIQIVESMRLLQRVRRTVSSVVLMRI